MKKTREYYVCDICGAEAPAQTVACGYEQTDTYETSPSGWAKGFNVHVDICSKCAAVLKAARITENNKGED